MSDDDGNGDSAVDAEEADTHAVDTPDDGDAQPADDRSRRVDSVDEFVETESSDQTVGGRTTPDGFSLGGTDTDDRQTGTSGDGREVTTDGGDRSSDTTDDTTPEGVDTEVTLDSRSRSDTAVELDVDEVLSETDESTGLFDDLLSGEPIFENKEVLRPSYTPQNLPHRNDQINQMATILVSALRGDTPSNILIYGKTGRVRLRARSSSLGSWSRRANGTTCPVRWSTSTAR
ncbi:MAG: hypothetical protein J07HB67_01904 [halophilic archaeon J07HB67]|jgi:Cdc6-related protein, AAA superfamily ATPase|nr:MAG: hypothetical protein J07HB67_01904 [halophilic archaeon J07HB67]